MLRLKEDPREWQKFVIVTLATGNVAVWFLHLRHGLSVHLPIALICLSLPILITAFINPHGFRGWYRGGMTVSHAVGQTMGKVLLTAIFFLFITPLALLLRLLGKDFLELKSKSSETTYWRPARNSRRFDRMF